MSLSFINNKDNTNGNKLFSFMNEFISLSFSWEQDNLHHSLVESQTISPLESSLLRGLSYLAEQFLSNINGDIFTVNAIHEALMFHSPITKLIIELFFIKFNPFEENECQYAMEGTTGIVYPQEMIEITENRKRRFTDQLNKITEIIKGIDTGRPKNDNRRKIILQFITILIDHIMKTNYFAIDKLSLGFRLNPHFIEFLDSITTISSFAYSQTERKQKFPEIPFGIFYVYHPNFF